jgi:hypothetical protein
MARVLVVVGGVPWAGEVDGEVWLVVDLKM